MMVEVLFLVIASGEVPAFADMWTIANDMYLSMATAAAQTTEWKIRHAFVAYTESMDASNGVSYDRERNCLWIQGKESYSPGIFLKTQTALRILLNERDPFESPPLFVIRTNLSTQWNVPVLCNLLSNSPQKNWAAGFAGQGFLSGTAILMTGDVAWELACANCPPYVMDRTPDDVLISRVLARYARNLETGPNSLWMYYVEAGDKISREDIEKKTGRTFDTMLCARIKIHHDPPEERWKDMPYFVAMANLLVEKYFF